MQKVRQQTNYINLKIFVFKLMMLNGKKWNVVIVQNKEVYFVLKDLLIIFYYSMVENKINKL
jgi:hypothetical protein